MTICNGVASRVTTNNVYCLNLIFKLDNLTVGISQLVPLDIVRIMCLFLESTFYGTP